jgi:hypothetical protein
MHRPRLRLGPRLTAISFQPSIGMAAVPKIAPLGVCHQPEFLNLDPLRWRQVVNGHGLTGAFSQ